MIVVTGGAGFIGSCIVACLNKMGHEDLIIVDHLEEGSTKQANLADKKYLEYFDKADFLERVLQDNLDPSINCVIHMGACSSTTLDDVQYYQKNNYEYSCHLAQWVLAHQARFIYASSAATYGDGSLGYSDEDLNTRRLKPLNLYGDSKQKFDLWVLDNGMEDRVVGLKFFNVFGPNEYHKGDMRSVVAKTYAAVKEEGKISLFKSYREAYANGEQKRDFIYVKDAVEIVKFFFEHPEVNGIYNAGTGESRSWNDLAKAIFAAVECDPDIEYIDMPEGLNEKYQYFTQAETIKLRNSGYSKPFTSLEDAVKDYSRYLDTNGHI